MSKRTNPRNLTLKDLAFLFSLVLIAFAFRWQGVQAVNIISSSMEPTLYGNDNGGDMVLLNKLAYKISEPERWNVVVFEHPETGEDYIKRLVGLPGEEVLIRNGDLYINGKIEPKNPATQSRLWLPVYPRDVSPKETLKKGWRQTGPGTVRFDPEAFEVRAEPGVGLCGVAYRRKVVDRAKHSNRVGDLRLAFKANAIEPNTVLGGEILDNRTVYGFSLSVGDNPGAQLMIDGAPVAQRADRLIGTGIIHDIVFSRADNVLQLIVDEQILLTYREERALSTVLKTTSSKARVGIRWGHARIEDIRLFRDIYYTRNGTHAINSSYRVPADHYFFLGDNSANSQDSRAWIHPAVPREKLTGKAFFVLNRFQSL